MTTSIVVDTSVFGFLTKVNIHSLFYRAILTGSELAISFQTGAELLASGYAPKRHARLDTLLAGSLLIAHSPIASNWYAPALIARRDTRRAHAAGAGAGDGDLWVIASALEHDLPLASHDTQQVALARAIGLDVYTALPRLRASNPV